MIKLKIKKRKYFDDVKYLVVIEKNNRPYLSTRFYQEFAEMIGIDKKLLLEMVNKYNPLINLVSINFDKKSALAFKKEIQPYVLAAFLGNKFN